MLAVSGVPWVTVLFLLACAWVLLAAGGMRGALSVSGLLAYGAKATPLILDRGETWRLLSANLLHKDLLHLAFNAFAIWNVGGALERAVRPADYLALIIFTALGTTVASAVGADSISLGASGIAFGVLGASATFGWRRAVRGRLRAHFGLRLLPWLFALFLAGLGSAGVDNWGHGGGLLAGAACGLFLTPRLWPGEAAARRLAGATGGLAGVLASGRAPAFAQGTTLHWVRGSDYVPVSDQMIRTKLNELAQKDLGLKINLEGVDGLTIQARVASAISSGSGPDIVCALNNWSG